MVNLPTVSHWSVREPIASILDILGDVRALWPPVERSGVTIQDYGRRNHDLTPSENVATWDTPPKVVERAVVYTFNGVDEWLSTPHHADFNFGSGVVDSAFSVVAVATPLVSVNPSYFLAKFNIQAAQREWHFQVDENGWPGLLLWDNSVPAWIGREYNVDVRGARHVFIVTYNGSGVAGGIKVYMDGVQVDNFDPSFGAYVAMESLGAVVSVGYYTNAAGNKDGLLKGEGSWFGITGKELSADEVWAVTQRLWGLLGV